MVGEQRLKETLNRRSVEYSEDTKDASFFDNMHRKFQNWKNSGSGTGE